MPLYDYRCEACGLSFEANHPISFLDSVACISCKSNQTHKILNSCRFNRNTDLGPTASHLMQEQRKTSRKELNKVARALDKLAPDANNPDKQPVSAGCVQHTRIELEDRYGKIFPEDHKH